MRNVSLIATGPKQNQLGWRRLEIALVGALSRLKVSRNPRAISLIGAGLLLGLALVALVVGDPQAAFQSLSEMLQL